MGSNRMRAENVGRICNEGFMSWVCALHYPGWVGGPLPPPPDPP